MSTVRQGERFTAYLTSAERQALRTKAREYGTSENYLVRIILRKGLGMDAPTDPPVRPTVEIDKL